MERAAVCVYASRLRERVLWRGWTDNTGCARPVVRADTANLRLPVEVACPNARPPRWAYVSWQGDPGKITVSWDDTVLTSTADLGKWELCSGSTHVYFDWPARGAAEQVLKRMVAQRLGVERMLGVPAEPMGAVLITDPKQRDQFITDKDGRTLRQGKFVHAVRSWPLLGGTFADLEKQADEERELYITFAHELAENTLLAQESVGVRHEGTRWFREGVGECAAVASAWTQRPGALARHLALRAGNLAAALKSGRTTTNLLDWKQGDQDLVNYACATAWFLQRERDGGFIAPVVKLAARDDGSDSAKLLGYLARAAGQDVGAQLANVDIKTSMDVLRRAEEDLKVGRPFHAWDAALRARAQGVGPPARPAPSRTTTTSKTTAKAVTKTRK